MSHAQNASPHKVESEDQLLCAPPRLQLQAILHCLPKRPATRNVPQLQDRMTMSTVASIATDTEYGLLGYVEWDGVAATSDRVFLKATIEDGPHLTPNQYVRIRDEDGTRSGIL